MAAQLCSMQTRVLLLIASSASDAIEPMEALTGAGFAVLIARTASDAMQALDRVRPDVVLVHSLSPRQRRTVSGWRALVARARQLGTPGYVVTRAGTTDQVPRFAWPGIDPGDGCERLPAQLGTLGNMADAIPSPGWHHA